MTMTPVACARCGAISWNAPPHGEGKSCPLAVEADKHYLAKLDAEKEAAEATRDYYTRAQMPVLDSGEAMRAMTKFFSRMEGEG